MGGRGVLDPALGPVLEALRTYKIFKDSKTVVDMPLRGDPQDVAAAFQAAFGGGAERPRASPVDGPGLRAFLAEHFLPAGEELEEVPDLTPSLIPAEVPEALRPVSRPDLAAFASDLHGSWGLLVRRQRAGFCYGPSDGGGGDSGRGPDGGGDRERDAGRAASPPRPPALPSSTLLPLPHPFVIPGSRFRECYYWDSFFIIQGLLASGAPRLAAGIARNLAGLARVHGFVPNGARTYYLNRSQPPLLSACVRVIGERLEAAASGGGRGEGGRPEPDPRPGTASSGAAAGAPAPDRARGAFERAEYLSLLREVVPALVQEQRYWTSGRKAVRLPAPDPSAHVDTSGERGAPVEPAQKIYHLSRYFAGWDAPRPESYREDVETARAAAQGSGGGPGGTSQPGGGAAAPAPARSGALWRELATAAESGWDFSSRWFVGEGEVMDPPRAGGAAGAGEAARDDGAGAGEAARDDGAGEARLSRLALTRITSIIPADLNALLYGLEKDLSTFAAELGDERLAEEMRRAAEERLEAIDALLWDERGGRWRDLECLRLEPAGGEGADEGTGRGAESAGAEAPLLCTAHRQRRGGVYASDWIPLWAGVAPSGSERARGAVRSLAASGLVTAGGVPASLTSSGEQWDLPNVWAPLQSLLAHGCARHGGAEGRALAERIAAAYLESAAASYARSGVNFEKLDCDRPGRPGGGGEYEVVAGFGWTNGVALDFIAHGLGLGGPGPALEIGPPAR